MYMRAKAAAYSTAAAAGPGRGGAVSVKSIHVSFFLATSSSSWWWGGMGWGVRVKQVGGEM